MVLFIGTFQIEVSSATIAAVLTIMGYSLNDTIVIFDRIRENEKLLSESSFVQVINVSITQSLSRTIITSITTLLAVTAIYIFTTGQIQAFALNMIVGVLVGTYSSIFIASPTLLGLSGGKRIQEKVKAKDGVASPTLDGESADAPRRRGGQFGRPRSDPGSAPAQEKEVEAKSARRSSHPAPE
jgi:preprotein translocase subunit SecF